LQIPIHLPASRASALRHALLSLAFVLGGVWLGTTGLGWGYVVAAGFGLALAANLCQLWPGVSGLTLGPDGLTLRSLGRTTFIRWETVERFFVLEQRQRGIRLQRFVGLQYRAGYAPAGSRLAAQTAGCDGMLPETYGLTAEELAARLNARLSAEPARGI